MKGIKYFLNDRFDFVEIKECNFSMHSSRPHLHGEISIGLIENSECNLDVFGKSYNLKAKTILIIPSENIHTCNPLCLQDWSFKMIYINKEWMNENISAEMEKIEFKYKELGTEKYTSIQNMFKNLGKAKSKFEVENNLIEIISNILDESDYTTIENLNKSKIKIETVKEYIDLNYLNHINLDDLSVIAELSKFYVIREFEKMYGISPYKYINLKKIAYAKNILKNSESIANTALESGFYDQSHFNRIFKEYTGITPMKYLKNRTK